jgi:hypothetical protein
MTRVKYFHDPSKNLLGLWQYLTRIMAVITVTVSCGSKCTAGTKNFKTKGFTWVSEVKLFSVHLEEKEMLA